jgi:hypothetical protein
VTESIHSSEAAIPTPPESTPQLSPLATLAGVFYRPTRAFQSIARRPSSWWMPFLLILAVFYLFYFGFMVHLDFSQLYQKALQHPTQQAWQIRNMPPEQLAQVQRGFKRIKDYGWIGGPLILLLYLVMEAAVLHAVLYSGFHAQARFVQVLAVASYSRLPGLITLLPMVLKLNFGGTPSRFWSLEWLGLSYYLSPTATPHLLYSISSAINLFALWAILLIAIGLAVVADTRRLHGLVAALVWWLGQWIIMALLAVFVAFVMML